MCWVLPTIILYLEVGIKKMHYTRYYLSTYISYQFYNRQSFGLLNTDMIKQVDMYYPN